MILMKRAKTNAISLTPCLSQSPSIPLQCDLAMCDQEHPVELHRRHRQRDPNIGRTNEPLHRTLALTRIQIVHVISFALISNRKHREWNHGVQSIEVDR